MGNLKAYVSEFDEKMNDSLPLKQRHRAVSIGPFIIELYDSDFLDRMGVTPSRLTIWKKVEIEEEDFRYKNVCSETYDSIDDAKSVAADIATSEKKVEVYINDR